jgi:ribosomal protein S19E (S16A)
MANRSAFWQKHPGLVWSNPDADDSAFIRAALLRGGYERLLAIAMEFGLERLRTEWNVLRDEGTSRAQRASASVERILENIEKGFALAAAEN